MTDASAVAVQPSGRQPAAGTPGEPGVTRRYAWGVFAMAFALMMFGYLDRQLVVSMFPYLKHEWGLSDAQLGGLVSVVSVTVAVGTFPVALLVDRRSRVKSIALMGSIWSLATISAAFTRNYGQLFASRAAVGLGEAGYVPAAGALLSRVFPQRLRATAFGAFLSAASLGTVLGVVLGGAIAEKWGWRAAFGIAGLPGLLLALLFLLVRDYRTVRLPASATAAPKLGLRKLLAELLRPRSAVAAYLGGAAQIVVMSALYAWLPSYFSRYLGLSTSQAAARTALVIMAGFLGQIVLSFAADRLARRDRRRRLLLPAALSLVSLVLLLAAFAAMPPGNPQLLVILVAGFTITAPFGVVGAVSVDVVHPALRATAVSMVALAQNLLGFAVGPLVVGAVSDAYGLKAALTVIPVFCALAAAFLWVASRHYDNDLRRVAASTATGIPAGKDVAPVNITATTAQLDQMIVTTHGWLARGRCTRSPRRPAAPPSAPCCGAGPDMVWIPGGRFIMGSDRHYPEEAPAHPVSVDGFWMDPHPVTNAQFQGFVEATGYRTIAERPADPSVYPGADPALLAPASVVFTPPSHPVDLSDPYLWWSYVPGANWRHPGGPGTSLRGRLDHPVTHVAWPDALAYAEWAGRQIPTEAEWEYAARGGLPGSEFAWGDEVNPGGQHMANTWQGEFPHENLQLDGYAGTSPTGVFPVNGYGLYDMIGNVWEWTSDWYAEHRRLAPSAPACCAAPPPRVNPVGGEEADSVEPGQLRPRIPRKVMKGGSHLCAPNYCRRYRPAARMPQPIDTSTCHLGFRCILRPAA